MGARRQEVVGYRVERMKQIYFYIKECGSVSTETIAEEFKVSTRTVQRAIFILRYNGLIKQSSRGMWSVTNVKVKVGQAKEEKEEIPLSRR
ncbi:HTH domain-containing protein [Priestia megaterium]|uniref:HTH domain-containing protein n=1 Tax=Priestia megaterium TaxID=1404 RepID=UPI003CFE326F